MPDTRIWKTDQGFTMHVPYFSELLEGMTERGRLPTDLEAHALWHYYCLALVQREKARKNIVAEDELSLKFDRDDARRLFESVAKMHGINPAQMVHTNLWNKIQQQRIALGGGDDLPFEMQFHFWGH